MSTETDPYGLESWANYLSDRRFHTEKSQNYRRFRTKSIAHTFKAEHKPSWS
jgi:hypothetical protein